MGASTPSTHGDHDELSERAEVGVNRSPELLNPLPEPVGFETIDTYPQYRVFANVSHPAPSDYSVGYGFRTEDDAVRYMQSLEGRYVGTVRLLHILIPNPQRPMFLREMDFGLTEAAASVSKNDVPEGDGGLDGRS